MTDELLEEKQLLEQLREGLGAVGAAHILESEARALREVADSLEGVALRLLADENRSDRK